MYDALEIVIEVPKETINEFCRDILDDELFNTDMRFRNEVFYESMSANILAIRDKSIAHIAIIDKRDSGRGDGGDINHGARIKIKRSKTLALSGDLEVILPKIPGTAEPIIKGANNKILNSEEVKLVKEIAKRCGQEFNVIFYHPDNPKRQAKAIKRIVEKCPEIINISLDDEKLEENLKNRIENNRGKK